MSWASDLVRQRLGTEPDGVRREARLSDHAALVKLIQASPAIRLNGGILAQPSDLPPEVSHLAMTYTALRYSDKCLMGIPGTAAEVRGLMELGAITRPKHEEALHQFIEENWTPVKDAIDKKDVAAFEDAFHKAIADAHVHRIDGAAIGHRKHVVRLDGRV